MGTCCGTCKRAAAWVALHGVNLKLAVMALLSLIVFLGSILSPLNLEVLVDTQVLGNTVGPLAMYHSVLPHISICVAPASLCLF